MKFQKNQKVKIVDSKEGHQFDIGEVATIRKVDPRSEDYLAANDADVTWWVKDDEIEAVD